jgi:hypothetical protein
MNPQYHSVKAYILKKLVLLVFFTGFYTAVLSQEFMWKGQYEFITDNREFYSPYGFAQTIMGARAAFEGGFKIDSLERIMFGGSYLYVFGAPVFEKSFVPTLYYAYTLKKKYEMPYIEVYMGSFPRQTFFPRAMYTDSLYYFRPNTQGITASVRKSNFLIPQVYTYQSFVFDWMTLENYGEKEEFLVGITGALQYKLFVVTDNFYYHHRAQENAGGGKDVIDNGAYSIMFGKIFRHCPKNTDTTGMTKPLCKQRAKIEVGNLLTWEQVRPQNTRYSQGLLASCSLYLTEKIDLTATYYKGDGTHLILGDPLYRSGDYMRFDAYYYFRKTERVHAYFQYSLHGIQGEINHSQKLYLRVTI